MIIKKQQAKLDQGYSIKPALPICRNCLSYVTMGVGSAIGERVERYGQCGIGRFSVKKTASCDFYKPRSR